MLGGSFMCDTEVETTGVALPFTMVYAEPALFRSTAAGPGSTYYNDMVFQNTKYPLVLIENKPRLAKFQPEIRTLRRVDGSIANPMCRTASNIPLGSHPELKNQLTSLIGKGAVVVNLTPPSVDLVVAVVGLIMMYTDGLPIVLPIEPTETILFLGGLVHAPVVGHTENEEDVYVASVVTPDPVPKTSSSSLKRSLPRTHKKEPVRSRIHNLPRKHSHDRNNETRKSKIRRLATAKSVSAQ